MAPNASTPLNRPLSVMASATRPSIEHLAELVRTEMEERKRPEDDAIREVLRRIRVEDDVGDWWQALAFKAFRPLVIQVLHRGSGTQSGISTKDYRESWRACFKIDPAAVWEMEFPIGDTGRVKPLHAWTADDLRDVGAFYEAEADRLVTRAELARRVARWIPPGGTLGDIRELKEPPADYRRFIESTVAFDMMVVSVRKETVIE